MTEPSEQNADDLKKDPDRRNFIAELGAFVIGGLVGLMPLVSGVMFLLGPILLRKKDSEGNDGFIRVAELSSLPEDGTPTRIVLRSDVRDAWTFYRDRIVGSAYFRRMPGDQVIAFSDTCPHLGCKVDYQASNKCFFCPCHQSAFELDGKRRNKTPPRDMDDLKIDVRDGVIWIKYENYKTGEAKKEVIS